MLYFSKRCVSLTYHTPIANTAVQHPTVFIFISYKPVLKGKSDEYSNDSLYNWTVEMT